MDPLETPRDPGPGDEGCLVIYLLVVLGISGWIWRQGVPRQSVVPTTAPTSSLTSE